MWKWKAVRIYSLHKNKDGWSWALLQDGADSDGKGGLGREGTEGLKEPDSKFPTWQDC